jgi:nucleoside-diphosphate-sugar epimerase
MSGIVILTGATGFVGRQVLRALATTGAKVRVIVRKGREWEVERSDALESIVSTEDLFAEDVSWWVEVLRDSETIIHCAWYAEPGKYLRSTQNLSCLIGTLQMAKGAILAGMKRFVGIGTCFEYDLTNGFVSIDTPLMPLTPYAGAKVAAFLGLTHILPAQGLEFSWCRLFYLHGEGEDGRRLIPYLRANLADGMPVKIVSGEHIRDFLDVRDAGQIITKIALSRSLGPVNVCSGIPITIRQIAEKIADEYGRRDLIEFGTPPTHAFNPPCVVGVATPL